MASPTPSTPTRPSAAGGGCGSSTPTGRKQRHPAATSASKTSDAQRLLGLTPDASPADIKRAYRAQALHVHPDKQQADRGARHDGPSAAPRALDFNELHDAYKCALDAAERRDAVTDKAGTAMTSLERRWAEEVEAQRQAAAERWSRMNGRRNTPSGAAWDAPARRRGAAAQIRGGATQAKASSAPAPTGRDAAADGSITADDTGLRATRKPAGAAQARRATAGGVAAASTHGSSSRGGATPTPPQDAASQRQALDRVAAALSRATERRSLSDALAQSCPCCQPPRTSSVTTANTTTRRAPAGKTAPAPSPAAGRPRMAATTRPALSKGAVPPTGDCSRRANHHKMARAAGPPHPLPDVTTTVLPL